MSWKRTAITICILLANIGWTADLSLQSHARSETTRGDRTLFPSLAFQDGSPYVDLLAATSLQWNPVTMTLALDSGRIYPVEPVSGVTFDNRDRGFVDTMALTIGNPTLELMFGWSLIQLRRGWLYQASSPQIRLTGRYKAASLSIAALKSVTRKLWDPEQRNWGAVTILEQSIGFWTLDAGWLGWFDRSGAMATLYNPLWPAVARLAPSCRDRVLICQLQFAQQNGFLDTSTTRLHTIWLGSSGYAGSFELRADGVVQMGRSSLTPLGQTVARILTRDHRAWSLSAAATWVGRRAEIGVEHYLASGDDQPLNPDAPVHMLIGILGGHYETLIFSGGINADFQTDILTTAGRMGFGQIDVAVPLRLYPGDWSIELRPALLWAQRAWPGATFHGARFYGCETDLRISWQVHPRLWLEADGGLLVPGNFPAPSFAVGSNGVGFAMVRPEPIWLMAGGLTFSWEQAWTKH